MSEQTNIELAKQALEFVEGCEVKAYAELDKDPSHREGMDRFRCLSCQEWCYESLRCDCCDDLDRGVARRLIPELAKRLLEAELNILGAFSDADEETENRMAEIDRLLGDD